MAPITPIDLWIPSGTRVRIDAPYFEGQTGTVKYYYYITGEYLVLLNNSKSGIPIPFTPSQIEKI